MNIRQTCVSLLTAAMLPMTAFCAPDDDVRNEIQSAPMKINLTVNGHNLSATLDDNATTRALVAKLPMTLPMMDLYGREMCYRFPDALPVDDARTQGYEVGEIVYYPPMHSLVIMYAQNGERFQMQKLGRVDSGVDVFNNIGDVDVTWSLLNSGIATTSADKRYSIQKGNDSLKISGKGNINATLFDLKGSVISRKQGFSEIALNYKGYSGIAILEIEPENGEIIRTKMMIR